MLNLENFKFLNVETMDPMKTAISEKSDWFVLNCTKCICYVNTVEFVSFWKVAAYSHFKGVMMVYRNGC